MLASLNLSAAELEATLARMAPHDASRIESVRAKWAPIMEARLTSDGFDVTAVSEAKQTLAEDQTARWAWNIKPKEPGTHSLHLVVLAPMPDGSAPPSQVALLNKEIEVTVTWWWLLDRYWEKYWKWILGGLGSALVSAVAWAFKRKRG